MAGQVCDQPRELWKRGYKPNRGRYREGGDGKPEAQLGNRLGWLQPEDRGCADSKQCQLPASAQPPHQRRQADEHHNLESSHIRSPGRSRSERCQTQTGR